MLKRFLGSAFFAFLLIFLGIASPAQAKDVAHDPDGGDEIAVASDPDGGDEAAKGTKGTINVTVGAAVGDQVADDPDGGDEIAKIQPLSSDPDGGDEVADDPDGGDEVSKVKTSDKKHAEAMNYVKS